MNSPKCISKFASIAAVVALSCADIVGAQEQLAAAPVDEFVAAPSVAAPAGTRAQDTLPAEVRRHPFGSKPVAGEALAARRGGDSVINDTRLKGVVADNYAGNLTTGMNVISDGAFAGSSGLSTVIQNSGNNVLIQNSTTVNLQLK